MHLNRDIGAGLGAAHLLGVEHLTGVGVEDLGFRIRRSLLRAGTLRSCALQCGRTYLCREFAEPGQVQSAELAVRPDEGADHGRPFVDLARAGLAAVIVDRLAVPIGHYRREAEARAALRQLQAAALEVVRGDGAVDRLRLLPCAVQALAFSLAIVSGSLLPRQSLALAFLEQLLARAASIAVRPPRRSIATRKSQPSTFSTRRITSPPSGQTAHAQL